jgi:putative ABC transport system permease protein
LRHKTDRKVFTKKLTDFVYKHAAEDMKAAGFSKRLFLQPVSDIHLRSDLKFDIGANGNLRFLYILGSVAIFLLLIACINFMNLSTARSARRAREVGIRKVVGALKASLIRQFLGESLLISFIALIVAVLLVLIFLPLFNQVTNKHLQITSDYSILFWFLIITIFTGLLAGIYPSFYLSSFNPLKVLKGIIQNQLSASFIRKGLVVFQFVISICLILGTIIIWQQMSFIKNQDIGFNKNQQLVIPLQTPEALQTYQVLKNQISKHQDVVSVSGSSTYPGITSVNDMNYYAEGKNVKDAIHVRWNYVDFGLMETLGFKVIKGRFFSRNFLADTANGIVLNEKAVQELGYDVNTAVDKKIYFDWEGQTYFSQIIGIIKDFNFESLHSTIQPFGFTMQFKAGFNYIIANIKTARLPELLTTLENEWKAVNAETPFEYSFLDEDFQRNYISDERLTRLITYFTFITIFVACLGLFALAAYTAEKRTKEIGIRKVLGATIPGIISLLSKDFIKLVLIAALIAFPVAWWGMNRWLQDFAYRVDISWWVFILGAAVAGVIALLTVSFQAIKAAVANPVKSLRTE